MQLFYLKIGFFQLIGIIGGWGEKASRSLLIRKFGQKRASWIFFLWICNIKILSCLQKSSGYTDTFSFHSGAFPQNSFVLWVHALCISYFKKSFLYRCTSRWDRHYFFRAAKVPLYSSQCHFFSMTYFKGATQLNNLKFLSDNRKVKFLERKNFSFCDHAGHLA